MRSFVYQRARECRHPRIYEWQSLPLRRLSEYCGRSEALRNAAGWRTEARSDHWAAFLEMAQTWEKLADLHELGRRLRSSGVLLDPPTR